MSGLAAGAAAPEVDLPLLGGGRFRLSEALRQGPVVLAFFKAHCPACELSFPFLQRLASRLRDEARVTGVGQSDPVALEKFALEFGIRMPIALDAPPGHAVSRAYKLAFVPTVFWIGKDGRIERASVGFDRGELSWIAAQAGAGELFTPEELRRLPARKPG